MAIKLDTSTIKIDRTIIHSIPKHKKDDFSILPQYSEQESDVSDTLKVFIKDKVIQSLDSNKELKVCYNPDNVSPISTYVNQVLASKGKDLVTQSKLMTEFLFKVQDGANASGILVVVYGTINDFGTCLILKLERDSGAQLKLNLKTKSFNMEEVKDLMLTQKTRIYKVALFIKKDEVQQKFDGVTADLQIDPKTKKEITTWFIEKYLGCIPLEEPKATTKKFYDYTATYIQTLEDPITKAKYTQDLNSYMQKNAQSISANEFAEDYLTTEHKSNYENYLKEKKFRMSEFPKDNYFVESKIKKITMDFANGISIIGKKGTFDKNVSFKQMQDGQTKAEIVSKVISVS